MASDIQYRHGFFFFKMVAYFYRYIFCFICLPFLRESWVPCQQTEQVAKTGIVFATEEKWVKKRAELFLSPLALDGEKAKKIIALSGINENRSKVNLDE